MVLTLSAWNTVSNTMSGYSHESVHLLLSLPHVEGSGVFYDPLLGFVPRASEEVCPQN